MVFLLLLIFYYSCYRVTRQGVEDSIGWLETIKQTKCSVCWIFVWIFTILHHSRLLLSNISNSQHNIFYIPSRHPFITSVFSVNPAASQVAVLCPVFEPRVLQRPDIRNQWAMHVCIWNLIFYAQPTVTSRRLIIFFC